MITTELRRAWNFHREHAGYCTPPGPAQCALDLARAELRARAEGVSFCWQDDFDPDTSWMDEAQLREYENGDTVLLGCIAALDEERTASLWGIHVGSPSDPYCRVVEAELASELLHELDRDEAEEAGIHVEVSP